jgi:hypothetical protein
MKSVYELIPGYGSGAAWDKLENGTSEIAECLSIAAEIKELKPLLVDAPEDNVIDKMSLVGKLESSREDLKVALKSMKLNNT